MKRNQILIIDYEKLQTGVMDIYNHLSKVGNLGPRFIPEFIQFSMPILKNIFSLIPIYIDIRKTYLNKRLL